MIHFNFTKKARYLNLWRYYMNMTIPIQFYLNTFNFWMYAMYLLNASFKISILNWSIQIFGINSNIWESIRFRFNQNENRYLSKVIEIQYIKDKKFYAFFDKQKWSKYQQLRNSWNNIKFIFQSLKKYSLLSTKKKNWFESKDDFKGRSI